ncbi:MAG: ribosome maturation factor RimP [Chitinispirillales bacterium]|nr:ribosome maturation factor RimP [Chitinispirillales bacterium]
MASFDQVKPLIESKTEEFGVELFDVRFFGAGPRSILRITIDRPGGVSISDCERVSGAVGAMLDEENFFDGKRYTLEVSSPGIDRPLKTERDFKRIAGRDVTVHLDAAINGKKCLRGKILDCADGILTIDTGKDSASVPLAAILSGKEDIRFK